MIFLSFGVELPIYFKMKTPLPIPIIVLCLLIISSVLLVSGCHKKEPTKFVTQTTNIEHIISDLSTIEKIQLVTGLGYDSSPPGIMGFTRAIPRHKIPHLAFVDGPQGIRLDWSDSDASFALRPTAFPSATALASTWDNQLVKKVGMAMGLEGRILGVDIILGPGINLHRNPLGGRNFEYYSEDPILTGRLATVMVQGIQSQGVGATLKHFVANNSETNRGALNEVIDEKSLRELYLRGFEIAVKDGKPRAVMTAYHLVNGEHTSQSKRLITDILSDEWGFNGLVMTDWSSGDNPPQQISAGVSIIMPGSQNDRNKIRDAIESKDLVVSDLNNSVRRVLHAAMNPLDIEENVPFQDWNVSAHPKLARRVAAQGMVLLKNHRALMPLKPEESILALFGNGSYQTLIAGMGSGRVCAGYRVNILEGAVNAGFTLEKTLETLMRNHLPKINPHSQCMGPFYNPPLEDERAFTDDQINMIASQADAAILTVRRKPGEGEDLTEEHHFKLKEQELSTLERVSYAFRERKKPVIVLLNVPSPVETDSWIDQADFVLVTWLGGQEIGNAIFDVLVGVENPSGHLTATWPRNYNDLKTARGFPGTITSDIAVPTFGGDNMTWPTVLEYAERNEIGYRDLLSSGTPSSFPFGYGLHYTDFSLKDLSIALVEDSVHLHVSVNNLGNVAGRDVVQIYVVNPLSDNLKYRELKGYRKTGKLEPGESQDLLIRIPLRELKVFDIDCGWYLPKGEYIIIAAKSAEEINIKRQIRINSGPSCKK